jgi:hypothetical protein
MGVVRGASMSCIFTLAPDLELIGHTRWQQEPIGKGSGAPDLQGENGWTHLGWVPFHCLERFL